MGRTVDLRAAAQGALERAHAWVFPPTCRACGELLPPLGFAPAPPGYPFLCAGCHGALPWSVPLSAQQVLALAWDGAGNAPGEVAIARFEPGPLHAWGSLESLGSAVHYAHPVNGWIRLLKYRRRLGVVRLMARLLAESPAGAEALRDAPWIVPVPLHPRRLWGRGFNQSLLLAHAWLRCAVADAGLPADATPRLAANVLVRHRYTRPQVTVTAAERRTNVVGAFSLHPRLARDPAPLAGRSVLLVDDVATTGATLQACAQVLRTAGAVRVRALVVAHG